MNTPRTASPRWRLSGTYDDPVGQVAQGLLVGDSLVVYFSDTVLSDSDRAAIDADELVGRQWTRIEMPALPTDADYDMSLAGEIKFTQEFDGGDPLTGGPKNYLAMFVAGQPGLTGSVARRSADDVGDGSAHVSYRILYRGTREFIEGTPTQWIFDSANDAVLVPEAP